MTDAAELYRALLTSGRLSGLRRLTYRCATEARCTLLDAVETPLGLVMHQVRYKYSAGENLERSSESGRAANTYDGANHWRERSYFVEQSALSPSFLGDDGAHLEVTCDHVLAHPLTADDFHADWEAGHAEVRVRPDRTRYPVC